MRATSLALFVAVVLAMPVVPVVPAYGVEPDAEAGARHLAELYGGAAADYLLVHERALAGDVPGAPTWAGKYVDRRNGTMHSAYGGTDGSAGTVAMLETAVERAESAQTKLERKADRALVAAVASQSPQASLPVAVWIHVDTDEAKSAVRAAHPEVGWLANRPLPTSLEQARALRGELWEARRSAIGAATRSFRAEVERLGGSVAYLSTSAPLVFIDVPPGAVRSLARRDDVISLGLERTWRTSMSSAGATVGANWSGGRADQGNGIRVAVIEYENASTGGDLTGQVVRSYSTTGRIVTGIHPTWVAGAIASRSTTWAGVSPGADIVTAGTGGYRPSVATDRAIIAAADWAVSPGGGDADVLNASIGQDTATGAEEARRYFDSVGWEDGRLVVAASGNYSTFGHWDVASPGTGYNVLTVGGVDDRNTVGVGDDRVWYVPGQDGAAYRDPSGTRWNRHGDYNKPNLAAPAVSVRTANGTIGSGTSVASPIVGGIAAQLLARQPTLVTWPEATRAILMAGALRRSAMPGGGYSPDHEGVGTASAHWSNRVLDQGAFGGWTFGAMRSGQTIIRDVSVVKGQVVRVALAWSSHTSGTSNIDKSNALKADLDLVVRQPNGQLSGSYSWDNSYEAVTFTATASGTMRIEIRHDRFDATEEPFGLAWAMTSPFRDIYDSPYYADILWTYGQKITSGCGGGKFCPRAPLSRGELATYLARALDLPASPRDYFTDDDDSSHEPGINAVAHAGIIGACDPGKFCPGRSVTRAQVASHFVRAFTIPPSSRDYFSDDDGNPHEARINALAAAGVVIGCGSGRYCPRDAVTRQVTATMLRRALTR
jgi:hypothetical protein